jgi:hypothetical protein
MEIGLEDTIGAIHDAVGSDVEDVIIAAGVGAGAGAGAEESPLVPGQVEDRFSFCGGIICRRNRFIDPSGAGNRFGRQMESGSDGLGPGMAGHRFIDE